MRKSLRAAACPRTAAPWWGDGGRNTDETGAMFLGLGQIYLSLRGCIMGLQIFFSLGQLALSPISLLCFYTLICSGQRTWSDSTRANSTFTVFPRLPGPAGSTTPLTQVKIQQGLLKALKSSTFITAFLNQTLSKELVNISKVTRPRPWKIPVITQVGFCVSFSAWFSYNHCKCARILNSY